MKCSNCGNEVSNNAIFCIKCGNRLVNKSNVDQEIMVDKDITEAPYHCKSKIINVLAITILFVILMLLCVMSVFFIAKGKRDTDSKPVEEKRTLVSDEETTDNDLATNNDLIEPLFTEISIPEVNIHEEKHTPHQKEAGMTWDGTLFYWLEDTDEDYEDEGNIVRCVVTKYLIRNTENKAIIEYNVYRDSTSNEIYKIVAIENAGNELKLTDYYYLSGKPNFIFSRADKVYTPVYASPEITGQRFYFNNDVMVRWRTIEVPNEIGEYTLTQRNVKYAQLDYFKQPDDIQRAYDCMERTMLNEAYNVYDAVSKAQAVGILKANVHDISMNPLADMIVELYRVEDDALLYRTTTDSSGDFSLNVALDGTKCYAKIRGAENYDVEIIYNIILDSAYPISSHSNIVMHTTDEKQYQANIFVYDSAKVVSSVSDSGDKSTTLPEIMKSVTVYVRRGIGVHDGDVEQTVTSDENGNISLKLGSGTYTLQMESEGYNTLYYELNVSDTDVSKNCFMVPKTEIGKKSVLLTWDNTDIDLDMTVFTPYQSSNGNMAHIGIDSLSDGYGNSIISDNNAFCELAYLNDNDMDNFKIYVNDYTDSMSKNYSVDTLSKINVHIYIYNSNGLVAEYTVPVENSGIVWEVVEINGKNYIPCQRVYKDVTGKNWWIVDKKQLDLDNCKNLKGAVTVMANRELHQDGGYDEICKGNIYGYLWKALKSNMIPCINEMEVLQELMVSDGIDNYGAYTCKQVEDILFSLTGQNIKYEEENIVIYWFEDYWDQIYDYTYQTEYIGDSIWKISVQGTWDKATSGLYAGEVVMTVTRNPNSMFDGYSIIGVKTILPELYER